MAVHSRVGDTSEIPLVALDAVDVFHIGGNLMEMLQNGVGLVAVSGKADPGVGVDGPQAILQGAPFLGIDLLKFRHNLSSPQM